MNTNKNYNTIGKVSNQNTPENIDRTGISWQERSFSHPERTIRIATSCSGIAAPEQALRQLGLNYEIVFAGDINKNVKKAYFANYPITEERWHDDLFKFDATPYKGEVDIFIAGICCQSFSRAGKMEGIADEPRGGLFKAFCRVIDECQPKIFMMENVSNMLTVNNGYDWSVIRSAMEGLGYELHFQVLDAKNYNCPQHRERLFCIGFKEHSDFLYPAPVKLQKNIRSLLEPNVPIEYWTDETGKSGVRRLTPRECLRIQGFSDDFKIVVPDSATYKQAGNSISVEVLKAIFTQMDITQYGV